MTGKYYRHFEANAYPVHHIAKHPATLEDYSTNLQQVSARQGVRNCLNFPQKILIVETADFS